MKKNKLKTPAIYVSPECESVDFLSNGIICASENFTIGDLPGNDWGDFSNEGGDF